MLFPIKKLFKILLFLVLICTTFITWAQDTLPAYPSSRFSTYYDQKKSFAETMPMVKDAIVFLGNSITDGAEWSELFPDLPVLSRGFSGDNTEGIINRLPDIVQRKPSKIFLLMGTNDLASGASVDSVYRNIRLIASYIHSHSAGTKLYVQSILPVNDTYSKFANHTKNGHLIRELNQRLSDSAYSGHYTFVNLHPAFADSSGKLNPEYTNDGLHLTGTGYMLWKHLIYHLLYDLPEEITLRPKPESGRKTNEVFALHHGMRIQVLHPSFKNEAKKIADFLHEKGWIALVNATEKSPGTIQLRYLNNSKKTNSYRYTMEINADTIILSASSPKYMKSAVNNLKQLLRDGVMAQGCYIQK